MRSRRLAAAAALTVAAFALSGCSVLNTLGSAADEARMSSALDELEAELKTIPGVTGVDAGAAIQGDLKFNVNVQVRSHDLTLENQRVIANAVTDLLASAPFSEQPKLHFSISEGEGETQWNRLEIDYVGLPEGIIARELDYLDSFIAAVGEPVSMTLYPPEPGMESYLRGIDAQSVTATIDWAAVRAIPDETEGLKSWGFPSVFTSGGIIPEKLEPLAAAIVKGDKYDFLSWGAADDYLTVSVDSEKQSENFEALPAWKRLVSLARLAEASGAGLDAVSASVGIGASAYLGECDTVRVDGIGEEFSAALRREGIDAQPGFCQVEQQY